MAPRPPVPPAIPDKLTVNFVLPHDAPLSHHQVDMIMVPAVTGQMGVLPGHVPSIAELKPGVLSVHDGDAVTRYFVSSGFAFVHANSVLDVCAVEAAPLDHIDPDEVRKRLADYSSKLAAATTDAEVADAQIGVEVHSALSQALGL
eukprot:SM000336S12815  [mRNA]  locus=s336:27374:27906:- [translate_table: standard]